MHEANGIGLDILETRQWELGRAIRAICDTRWTSLAPEAFAAPSVVVCHARTHEEHKGIVFKEQGMQIAAGAFGLWRTSGVPYVPDWFIWLGQADECAGIRCGISAGHRHAVNKTAVTTQRDGRRA